MAKRANQPFFTAVDGFKKKFEKDAVVPDAIAKKLPGLVYDDGAPKPAKSAAVGD